MKKECICCGKEIETKHGGMLICPAGYTKLQPNVLKKKRK